MEWTKSFDLFLFDLDGLLVNTEHIHYQAYLDMCSKRGFQLDWSFEKYEAIAHTSATGIRMALESDFPLLFQNDPWEVVYNEKKEIYISLLKNSKIKLMPGVEKLLNVLQKENKKRCVVTHSAKNITDLIRAGNPVLNSIPNWITREDYLKPKPDPECYLRAITLFGKKGDRIIGFEDSIKGLQALYQTSALCVLVCHAHHPQMDSALPKGALYFETVADIKFNDNAL